MSSPLSVPMKILGIGGHCKNPRGLEDNLEVKRIPPCTLMSGLWSPAGRKHKTQVKIRDELRALWPQEHLNYQKTGFLSIQIQDTEGIKEKFAVFWSFREIFGRILIAIEILDYLRQKSNIFISVLKSWKIFRKFYGYFWSVFGKNRRYKNYRFR